MIRPLRQRHRAMVLALSVVVPAAFAFGVATRREVPASLTVPPHPATEDRNGDELWTRIDLLEKPAIRTRLLKEGADSGQLAVELVPTDPIVRPDMLVYWVPEERNKIQDPLPDDAFLLGSFEQSNPHPFALPVQAAKQPGVLVIYSLADQAVIAKSKSFFAK